VSAKKMDKVFKKRMGLIIGTNLFNLRKSKNLTQEELGEIISVTRNSIVQIERGTQFPSLHTIYTLSRYFKCDISCFIPLWDISQDDEFKKFHIPERVKMQRASSTKDLLITINDKLDKLLK